MQKSFKVLLVLGAMSLSAGLVSLFFLFVTTFGIVKKKENHFLGRPTSAWLEDVSGRRIWLHNYPLEDALQKKPDPAAIPVLIDLLHDSNPSARWLALECLAYLGPEARPVRHHIRAALRDSNIGVRREAAKTLAAPSLAAACRNDKSIEDALTRALTDRDKVVRMHAALGLWRVSGQSRASVDVLIAQVKNEDDHWRKNRAIEAIGTMGPDAVEALPTLLDLMNDKGLHAFSIRWKAIEAVGRLGPRAHSAVPALVLALRDDKIEIRVYAAIALWRVTGQLNSSVPTLIEIAYNKESDSNRYVVDLSIRTLREGGIDAATGIPLLITALTYDDSEMRLRAARALRYMGPLAKVAIPALTAALDDKSEVVRSEVALTLKALEQMKD